MNFLDARLPSRFWDKVIPEPNSGCWLWIGGIGRNGYGYFWENGSVRIAHRVSFLAAVGPLTDGLALDHLCRTRCCVNPSHLDEVTQQENCRRGETGKHLATRTHCPRGHEYTTENTTIGKSGSRFCRACQRERHLRQGVSS